MAGALPPLHGKLPPPLAGEISRVELQRLAIRIRDDLDLLVAREGPSILQPDDALALHDQLIALRYAPEITALDLRATGIHRAIQDISGVATRWPGRLCDICDEIIRIWTAKFGQLSNIHPVLYGRGGRLEGVATVSQYSREELLTRWHGLCPEAIHPQLSHRLGSLGFRVGAWWINSLFAHHAGIIGIESCEGGTTFDKDGAYAIVLKGTGETEATSEDQFTYRVPQDDKGKFRLTAATAKSRDPIRVLRSHSINSIWGPKAGIRYEGLYSVKGWSIKQAKTADTVNKQWKEGDLLYDIKFERNDPIPMSEALRRPTATELDDYLEYKRLRKLYRADQRNAATADPDMLDKAIPARREPAVPLQPTPLPPVSPMTLQDSFFKILESDKKPHMRVPRPGNVTSALPSHSREAPSSFTHHHQGGNTLQVPLRPGIRLPVSNPGQTSSSESLSASQASSLGIEPSTLFHIKEVAPWIGYDADLPLAIPSQDPSPTVRDQTYTHSAPKATTAKKRAVESRSPSPPLPHVRPIPSPPSAPAPAPTPNPLAYFRDRKKSANTKELKAQTEAKKDGSRFPTLRARGPLTKYFDGSLEEEEKEKKVAAAAAEAVAAATSVSDWFDRDAICPPSEWEWVPQVEASPGEEARVFLDGFVKVSFVDPFAGRARTREGRRGSSVGLAPDEMVAGH